MDEEVRYIVGIDLGTTNCAMAYWEKGNRQQPERIFEIPQLTAMGYVQSLSTLPSCCLLTDGVGPPLEGAVLPWGRYDYAIGAGARDVGAKLPTRLVASAKSWLCNAAVGRKERVLPPLAEENLRISPLEASKRYLVHLRDAWNRAHRDAELEQQEVILTVPASFDEIARTLTARAAREAGLTRVSLIEEPQAAFYNYIGRRLQRLQQLQPGDTVVVCDVGGGTTDFSLIEVRQGKEGLAFARLAVGDHLLLGGDNMDQAIAHRLAAGVPSLDASQWHSLVQQARQAKEQLLGDDLPPSASVRLQIQGSGSRVVSSSQSLEVTRSEIESLLLTGFFGQYDLAEALDSRPRSGIQSMGLPFETEPSITKHLAAFLFEIVDPQYRRKPTYLLFNGGVLKVPVFQEALVEAVGRWYADAPPKVLPSDNLDLAVAYGAVVYGRARHGDGIRIGGGAARGYYIQLDGTKALTLLPRGCEEGDIYECPHVFELMANTPVSFQLLTSHVRLNDTAGSLVEMAPEEVQSLPPLCTVLRYGKKKDTADKLPVHLVIRLTAVGTLEMWLQAMSTDHRWTLEFQVRGGEAPNEVRQDETHTKEYLEGAVQAIRDAFNSRDVARLSKLLEAIEQLLGKPRSEWSVSTLRGLWDCLLDLEKQRKLSVDHEARWWNLAGLLLRPGCGYPLDDHRIQAVWKIILADSGSSIQRFICYRRLAGGLSKGQQAQLASVLLPQVEGQRRGKSDQLFVEALRALAAFEKLDLKLKERLAELLLKRIEANQAGDAEYWALGRLGARHLLYGTIANAVSSSVCSRWIERLLRLPLTGTPTQLLMLGQLARHTDQRELNIPPPIREQLTGAFAGLPQADRLKTLLEKPLSVSDAEAVLGDRLPPGLTLLETR